MNDQSYQTELFDYFLRSIDLIHSTVESFKEITKEFLISFFKINHSSFFLTWKTKTKWKEQKQRNPLIQGLF